jgi:hypothetical protein
MLENKEITPLLRTQSPGSVSIYMATDLGNRASRENTIRFHNLLRQAESELKSLEMPASDVERILEPGRAMLGNTLFWSHQDGGLAMFLSPLSYSHQRLPEDPGDRLYVDSLFHIRPLLQYMDQDRTYYVLALSLSGVTLYRCQGCGLEEVPLIGDLSVPPPNSRARDRSRQLQFHTGAPSGSGVRPALYHGHGSTQQGEREAVLAYFRQEDARIGHLLSEGDAPLVLAGVKHLWTPFRQVSSYPFIVDGGVEGSPDGMSLEQVHERSLRLVQPVFDEERRQALALYSDLKGTDMAHETVEHALPSAFDGRVEILLVDAEQRLTGTFDTASRRVRREDEGGERTTELLNLASIYTLLRGGRVITVPSNELASSDGLAALLRYRTPCRQGLQ